jgi:serine/threonine protein kinase
VLDFGLARLVREAAPAEGEGVGPTPNGPASELTPARLGVGTANYLSPEEARGRRADIRSDIYSLGCTLYHLLAGHPPFPGGTAGQKLRRHLRGRPTPLEVPGELARVVARMMAKDSADRYQTPAEVAQALASVA